MHMIRAGRIAFFLASLGLLGCSIPDRDVGRVRDRVVAEAATRASELQPATEPRVAPPAVQDAVFEEDGPLDLHGVLLWALDHNPRIRAARYRFRASEARERASGWLGDPRFSWTHGFREIQTRGGPIDDVFSITQLFPYWGKLAAERDAASARAWAAREELLATELDVLRDVQQAYFGIWLTGREMEINESTTGILERFVVVAQRKVAAGRGGQQDILLAEVELARLENERIDLEQRLLTEKALLNTLLDRPPGAPLPPVGDPEVEYRADVDSLVAWMLENLPDLERHERLIEENRANLRGARLRFVPDLSLGLNYTMIGGSPVESGSIDSGRDGIGGVFGIDIPLWVPRYSAEVDAALESLRASRSALEDAKLVSTYRVIEMHVKVETALRQVELLRDEIVPKARQTLDVLEAGYEGGTLDFLKLLDAERALERFLLEDARARAEFEERLADLERAVGKPLRAETKRPSEAPIDDTN